MCTFDVEGGSIVKAANSGLKTDSLSVSTSIRIHTSAGTQLKIGENQTTLDIIKWIIVYYILSYILSFDTTIYSILVCYVFIIQLADNDAPLNKYIYI